MVNAKLNIPADTPGIVTGVDQVLGRWEDLMGANVLLGWAVLPACTQGTEAIWVLLQVVHCCLQSGHRAFGHVLDLCMLVLCGFSKALQGFHVKIASLFFLLPCGYRSKASSITFSHLQYRVTYKRVARWN